MSAGHSVQLKYKVQRADFTLDVALDIPMQGITGIFGASGAGKTTLLRCIAGLEDAKSGELIVAGDCWQDTNVSRAAYDRNIGYVFQEPRLFRHLDVRANIEYGMRRSASDDGPDFATIIELLGLESLLARRPIELSGGEAQRVAIARALLRGPKFVLMDEPLASLDAARKEEILPFLERLHIESSIPVIYVSHNLDEICRLCDHLVVLDAGKIVANGELQSVLVKVRSILVQATSRSGISSSLPVRFTRTASCPVAGELAMQLMPSPNSHLSVTWPVAKSHFRTEPLLWPAIRALPLAVSSTPFQGARGVGSRLASSRVWRSQICGPSMVVVAR